jgi:hypothetical protein
MLSKHRRGPWTTAEDQQLLELVHSQGATNWVRISQLINTRSPKQCRERFHQNLKPSLNLDPITPEEGVLIEKMVAEMGKRWAEIARRLHNRSDNAVKNWWNGGMNRRRRLENRRAEYAPRQSGQQQQPIPQQPLPQQQMQQTPQPQHQHQQQQHPQQMQQQHMQQPHPQQIMPAQQQYPQHMMQMQQHDPQQQHQQDQQQNMVSSYDFYPRQQPQQPQHMQHPHMPYGQPQQMMNPYARRIMEQQHQNLSLPSGYGSYSRAESTDGAPPSLVSDMSYGVGGSYSNPNTPRGSNELAPMGQPVYHQRQTSNLGSSYNVGSSYPVPSSSYPAPGMDMSRQAYPVLDNQWRQSTSPDQKNSQMPFGGSLPLPGFNTLSGSPGSESKDSRMKLSNLMS